MALGKKLKKEQDRSWDNDFHGRKQEAKEDSNKRRRQVDHMIANGRWDELEDDE